VKRSNPGFGNSSQHGRASSSKTGSTNFSRHRSVSGASGFLKRTFDLALAAFGLIVLSPLLAIIAVAIRLTDGGSIFYRQVRIGLNRRRFTIVKFRTMHENAERDLGAIWSVPGDPRCTRIGYYLRRLGLDELPQLWNVLRGDMSLVGPRPERPEFTRQFCREHQDYDVRHTVRPGITGYAQVHGWRGYTSLEERLRHDIHYVRNWSLRLDAYVLFLTLIRGWSAKTRSGLGRAQT
jgi:exopolysaccharide biosynthesis polyprenyl glycosylphosphotransferase